MTFLHALSGYAYGRSTMLAEEVSGHASAGEWDAALIADPYSLTGCVEFASACRRVGVRPLIGATVDLPQGGEVVLVARSREGYRSLTRLLTECHMGEPRLFPLTTWERIEAHTEGLLALTGGDRGPLAHPGGEDSLDRLAALMPLFLQAERSSSPWTVRRESRLISLAESRGWPIVAGGPATHARREHFPAQDVLVCVDTLCLLEEIVGRKPARAPGQPPAARLPERAINGERFLRTTEEARLLYADRPEWLAATYEVAAMCEDNVLPPRTVLPTLYPDDGEALRGIVESRARAVYGPAYGVRHRRRLEIETERIVRLGYASHFLIAWDLVRWATENGVHTSGRGSVVDSAVAYVLGLSRVDAIRHRLHFDRFLPDDGGKRPDIDLDFEAARRDDARNHLVSTFGAERVATIGAVGAYCVRGIVREVGKVFGLPEPAIAFLAKRIHGGVSPDRLEDALSKRPELRDAGLDPARYRPILMLAERLQDIPRNLRLHSSGIVISRDPIRDTVPVQWAVEPSESQPGIRLAQWDKRAAKHFFDKFDVLCLRGQDAVSGTERRVRTVDPSFDATRLGASEDPEVYRAMRSGELIGVPQSASPAMRQAHVRLRTADLHDASLVQAGIRPGVGGAVKINELIARRRGKPSSYSHPEMEAILGGTYGIIVFQEQVDQLLQTFGGFTGGEAEEIRDAIHKRRREEFGETIRDKLVERVIGQGHSAAVAGEVAELVTAFKGYGFAQGHALAFAEISLRCVSLMQNHPAEYFAALLSAQPAGYYGPATLVNEARGRGVVMRPPCVMAASREFATEPVVTPEGLTIPNGAIRVGLMNVAGLSTATLGRVIAATPRRGGVPPPLEESRVVGALAMEARGSRHQEQAMFRAGRDAPPTAFRFLVSPMSLAEWVSTTRPARDELENLILAGALNSFSPHRRALLWAVPELIAYAGGEGIQPSLPLSLPEPALDLSIPDFRPDERAMLERAVLGLDVERHLMAFERERIAAKGGLTAREILRLPAGTEAIAVGHAIRLRFPPTRSGNRVVFWDLEDESGLLNVTAFDDVYQRDGHAIVCAPAVTVLGTVQDRDGAPAFLARRVFPFPLEIGRGSTIPVPLRGADFLVG